MQIIYPNPDIVHDPGQPWDGSNFTDLLTSEVLAYDCPSIMEAVDRPGFVSHPVSCGFVNLPEWTGGTVYFMDPNTLAYVGSIQVRQHYDPILPEDVIFDVFVSIVVVNWILDFVLFFSYLRKKVRKIRKS